MAYATYRSSYNADAGYGFSTPTKPYGSTYGSASVGGRSAGYYDLGPRTETPTPLSGRGGRYSAEGYQGLTPTPGQRPLSSGSTQRRAITPTTGSSRNWDTTPSSAGGYGYPSTTTTTPYGGVRKDLTPELSLAQDRYSSRNNLASLHPSNTASSTSYGRQSTGAHFSHQDLAESNLSAAVPHAGSPQREGRNRTWNSGYLSTGTANGYSPSGSPKASPRRTGRPPSMDKTGYYFLPAQDPEDRGKPLVVLDLDETLVYARSGPVNIRPGVRDLLATLDGRAEVAVWTAGERDYAQSVIQRIDPNHTIKHCVYRHPKWWSGQPGYSKNLKLLGRPLDRVIMVDNTPDCLKDQPWNCLLVEDYTGRADTELTGVTDAMDFILEADPNESIPDILSRCPHVCRRRVPLDGYGQADLWTLTNSSGDYSPGRGSRVNRDISQRASSVGRTTTGGSGYWRRY